MSTRIHHAYRLPEGDDALRQLEGIREVITPIRIRADLGEVARLSLRGLDAAALGRAPEWFSATRPLLSVFRDRQEEFNDNGCQVAVLCDPADGRHHVIVLTGHETSSEVLGEYFASLGWTDYHYQNASERPEDVTEEEWETRREAWDRMVGYGPLSQYAAVFSPIPSGPRWVLPFVSENKDALAEALDELQDGRLRRLVADQPPLRLDSPEQAVDWLFDTLDLFFAAEAAGDARLAETATRLRPVTVDDLYGPSGPTHDLTDDDLGDLYEYLKATYGG